MQILCMRYNIMLQIPSAISSFDLLSIANRFLLAIDLKRVSGNRFDTNWILQENIFLYSFLENFSLFIQKKVELFTFTNYNENIGISESVLRYIKCIIILYNARYIIRLCISLFLIMGMYRKI